MHLPGPDIFVCKYCRFEAYELYDLLHSHIHVFHCKEMENECSCDDNTTI